MQNPVQILRVSAPSPLKFDLAVDLGNSGTKIRATNNQSIAFRSILGHLSNANQMGKWPVKDVMFFEGRWWVAGEAAYTYAPQGIQENTTVARYTSSWYRTLFAFSLHKALHTYAGQGEIHPRIISSLPAEIYKDRLLTNCLLYTSPSPRD